MKRIISLILCALLAFGLTGLAGCNSKDELTVATNAEFDPFEFMKDKKIVGFDIDLINAIAEKMDMTVKLDNMEFDGVVAAVQSGSSKVAISGLTITPKRQESVDFSIAYYYASQMIITMKDDDTYSGTTKEELDEQLKGKKIGVCAGFTGKSYVEGDEDLGFEGLEGATTKIYDNISLAIADLKNGAVECIVMDDTVAKKAAAASTNSDLKVIDVKLTNEEYGIAVKKGDAEMKEKIDRALTEFKNDGTIDELIDKWIVNNV